MLWGWPRSSASLNPLIWTNWALTWLISPLGLVVEKMLACSGKSTFRPVTGRFFRTAGSLGLLPCGVVCGRGLSVTHVSFAFVLVRLNRCARGCVLKHANISAQYIF